MTNEEFRELARIAQKHFDRQAEKLEELRDSLLHLLEEVAGEDEKPEEEVKKETTSFDWLNNLTKDVLPDTDNEKNNDTKAVAEDGDEWAENTARYAEEEPKWQVFNENAIDFGKESIDKWREVTVSYRTDMRSSGKGFPENVRIDVEDDSDPAVVEAALTYALAVIVNRLGKGSEVENRIDEDALALKIAGCICGMVYKEVLNTLTGRKE